MSEIVNKSSAPSSDSYKSVIVCELLLNPFKRDYTCQVATDLQFWYDGWLVTWLQRHLNGVSLQPIGSFPPQLMGKQLFRQHAP